MRHKLAARLAAVAAVYDRRLSINSKAGARRAPLQNEAGATSGDEDIAATDREALRRELAEIEDEVDRAAAKLWGLTDAELAEIRKALELLK